MYVSLSSSIRGFHTHQKSDGRRKGRVNLCEGTSQLWPGGRGHLGGSGATKHCDKLYLVRIFSSRKAGCSPV